MTLPNPILTMADGSLSGGIRISQNGFDVSTQYGIFGTAFGIDQNAETRHYYTFVWNSRTTMSAYKDGHEVHGTYINYTDPLYGKPDKLVFGSLETNIPAEETVDFSTDNLIIISEALGPDEVWDLFEIQDRLEF